MGASKHFSELKTLEASRQEADEKNFERLKELLSENKAADNRKLEQSMKNISAGMSANFTDLQSVVARRSEDIIQSMSDIQEAILKNNKLDEDASKLLMLMAQQLKQFNSGLEALSQKLNSGHESLAQQLNQTGADQTTLNRQMLSELQTLNRNYDKIMPSESRAEFETNVQHILIGVNNAVKHLDEEVSKNLGEVYALIDDLEKSIAERGEKQLDALSRMSDALEDIKGASDKLRRLQNNLNEEIIELNGKLPSAEVRAEELQQLIADNWKHYETLTGNDIALLNRLADKLK